MRRILLRMVLPALAFLPGRAAFADGAARPAGATEAVVDRLGDLYGAWSRSSHLVADGRLTLAGVATQVMRTAVSEGGEWIEYARDGSSVARWSFRGMHWAGAPVRHFTARVSTDGRTYRTLPLETAAVTNGDGWAVLEYRCTNLPPGTTRAAVVFPETDDERSWNPRMHRVDVEFAPADGPPPAAPRGGSAIACRIENTAIEVTCDAGSGRLALRDKVSGETWAQKAADLRHWELAGARQEGGVLDLHYLHNGPDLDAPQSYRVRARLPSAEPEVVFDLDADPGMPLAGVAFPAPFYHGGSDAFAVYPSREGRLLAESSRNPRFSRDEASCDVIDRPWPEMRCFGTVRLTAGTACMAVIETPDDALIARSEIREEGTDFAGLAPFWQSEMGRFGYPRRVHYRLFPKGGYVAMAGHYRRYLESNGAIRTLRDKARSLPLLETFTRSAFLDCASMNHEENVEVARLLRAQGYPGSFTSDADGWYRKGGPLEWKYRVLQHRTGGAVCFKDILPQDPGDFEMLQKRRDGRPTVGWMLGNTVMAAVCQDRIRGYAERFLPYFLQNYRCDFLYHDTTSAMPLQECHHPGHPLNRRQEKQRKIELLDWLASGGVLTSSEDAADWAAAHLAVLAGPSSRGHVRGLPVPFFALVFHDTVVSQYRVDWSLHDQPESFALKKAHDILYGDPPVFRWRSDLDATQRAAICRTSIGSRKFFEQVAFRKLIDHRFLNADLTLEMCAFEGAAAYANFSSAPARIDPPGGPVDLPPFGYHATAENFLAYDALRGGGRCEYARSSGFVFLNATNRFESDLLQTGPSGARISVSQLSPGRLLVFHESAEPVRVAPGRLAPGWDHGTARAFRWNGEDERAGEVPLAREGAEWIVVPGPGILEVACGRAARCPDLRVDADSIRISETALRGGGTVTVSATVTNVGDAPASAEIRFLLDSATGDGTLLASQSLPVAVGAGAEVSATVPLGGARGRRSLWVLAGDAGGAEVNLLNNAAPTWLEIGESFHARFQRKAFDFGPGACQPGFTAVRNEPYDAARGWGWIAEKDSPPLQFLLGSPSPQPPPSGNVYVVPCKGLAWAGPLLGDAVGVGRFLVVGQTVPPPKADHTFVADMPDGDYAATVVMVSGVRAWQTESLVADVFLNGKRIASPATHRYEKGHFLLTDRVRVTDGKVRLRFLGDWWQLCALALADPPPRAPAPPPPGFRDSCGASSPQGAEEGQQHPTLLR